MIFATQGDYAKAAEQLEILVVTGSADDDVVVNLAVSYTYAGEVEKALSVLAPRPAGTVLPLPQLKTRALIMQGSGRTAEAFNELKAAKASYFGEPDFLLALMNMAYAVGEEREAHEALIKLQSLRDEGKVDDKLMRAVSMDEVRGWIENGAKRQDL